MSSEGIVKIHGKEYQTVAKRVADFRKYHPEYPIKTKVINSGDVVIVKASIKGPEGKTIATGYAEEVRGSTNINRTSALENCETSAVGRALAFFGYGGTEIASANEVSDAIIQQAKEEVGNYFVKYNSLVRDLFDSIYSIKNGINNHLNQCEAEANLWLSSASEAYFELSDEEKMILNLAPTKGGIFTTEEREIMKSKEFREAYFSEESK